MRKTVFFILFLACVNYGNAQICFSPKAQYKAGVYSYSLCTGDFNRDHIIDLAAANKSGSVSVFKGNANGSFTSAADFPTGFLPVDICSGDFNGDSLPDLATPNGGPWNITLLPGTGSGTFSQDTAISGAANPHAMCTADFNTDGNTDLALATQFTVMVLTGDGTGNFMDSSFATGHSYSDITAADFNGDSLPDLAMSGGGNNVTILIGLGNGSFAAPITFQVDTSPLSIVAADFNRDGNMDLATCNRKNNIGGNVSVVLGDGNGNFGAAANFPVGVNSVPGSICSADFNGDSIDDLALTIIANNNTPYVAVLQGNGNGTFTNSLLFEVDSFPHAIVSADFNGDEKMDLAVVAVLTNNDTGNVDILLNCNSTGIYSVTEEIQQVVFYPNPGNGIFNIQIPHSARGRNTLKVFSTEGQLVLEQKNVFSGQQLNISKFGSGNYLVRIETPESSFYKRLSILE